MMSTRTARMLTRYNAWANRTLFDGVAALPPGEATKERQSLFKSIVKTLNHLYVVDLIWRAHLEGRSHDIPALNTVLHPELDALYAAQRAVDEWYVAWSDKLAPADLDRRVNFTLLSGNKGEMAVRDIVLHLVNHTSYHRGFVGDLFYQVPAVPPLTDLPIYLREHGEPS